ncbi:sugar ABC transporter substrate-binding protein [Candidatus Atribacteria bacterium HGW-Atribacteria-1]|nr:MAG: sugar ABC transporter substrate-binding protein [Candidatus Atribacteria bacterium HGW-Atribacteria-1]
MKRFLLVLLVLILSTTILTTVFAAGEKKEDWKFAVTGVLHPYFEPWGQVVKDYMDNTSIKCEYRATQHFDQEEANVIIEGMLALGYNAFAMWPGHPVSVNVTITELVNQGIPVVLIAGPAELPTDASLCIATDVKGSAMKATENLIKAIGEKGNIVNLIGALSDPNTILRKKGVEEVVARYPDVSIIAELADIDAFEVAAMKIDSLLAARAKEIDGMVATCYVPTVVSSEALTEIGDKRIKFIGIDDDPKVIQAIKDGYITGTMTQSPYGQAYIGLAALRLLKSGYTVKEGVYFIDSGSFLVTADNVDRYAEILKANAMKMLETFTEDYFNPPK